VGRLYPLSLGFFVPGGFFLKVRDMNKDKIEYDFDADAFLKVNKGLLSRFGPEVAVFISNLMDKNEYFNENFPDNDGWFFLIHNQQMEQTGLTIWKLYKCKRIAILNNWIEIKWKGSPAKEWYKINLELLNNQLAMENPNSSTIYESVSNGKTSQQAIRKPHSKLLGNLDAHIKENKEGDYNKDNKEEKKEEIFKEENPNPLGSKKNITSFSKTISKEQEDNEIKKKLLSWGLKDNEDNREMVRAGLEPCY